jgi:hypothetical protein
VVEKLTAIEPPAVDVLDIVGCKERADILGAGGGIEQTVEQAL